MHINARREWANEPIEHIVSEPAREAPDGTRQLVSEHIEWTRAGNREKIGMSNFMIVSLIFLVSFGIGCSQSRPSSPPAAPARPQTLATDADASVSRRNTDLVRAAVEEHVRNDPGINLSAMDMSVDSVNFSGDQAQANVTFRLKQGGPTMEMIYWLERQGKVWQVARSQPADGPFVHPPMDPTHPNASPNPATPAIPDVREFLNNHPATNSSGT